MHASSDSSRQTAQLTRNVLTLYLARVLAVAASLVLFPLIVTSVGLSQYGVWLLISSVTFFFQVSDFGMGTSTITYVARHHATDETALVNRVVSTGLAFFALLGVVAAAGFALFFLILWDSFHISAADRPEAAVMVGIVALNTLAVGLPLNVFKQVLVGVHRMDVVSRLTIAQTLLRCVLIPTALVLDFGIVGVAVSEALAITVTGMTAAVLCRRHVPGLQCRLSHVSLGQVREMTPFSLQAFVLSIAALLILQVDNTIIGLFMPIAAVTLYAGAYRFYQVARDLAGGLMAVVIPDAARAQAVGDADRLREVLVRGTKYANVLILGLCVPVTVFAEALIVVWLGPQFAEAALVVQILMFGLVVNNNHIVAVGILLGLGRVGRYVRYHVIWALANLAISIALVKRIGLPSVALGTTLPLLVLEPFYVRAVLREVGLDASRFVTQSILRPLAAAAISGALLLAAIALVPGREHGAPAVALAIASFLGTIAAFYFVGLDEGERRHVGGMLRSARASLAGRLSPAPAASVTVHGD